MKTEKLMSSSSSSHNNHPKEVVAPTKTVNKLKPFRDISRPQWFRIIELIKKSLGMSVPKWQNFVTTWTRRILLLEVLVLPSSGTPAQHNGAFMIESG